MDYLKLGLLFSAFGCFFEVVFTSIYDSIVQYIKGGRKKVDVRFFGYWSILYILVYGVVLSSFWNLVAVPYIYPLHWGCEGLSMGFVSMQANTFVCTHYTLFLGNHLQNRITEVNMTLFMILFG